MSFLKQNQTNIIKAKPIQSVLIIGGGIGGLALAQLLKGSNLKVTVYERDSDAKFRQQGFYIGLNSDGLSVITQIKQHCPDLDFILRNDNTIRNIVLVDEKLRELLSFDSEAGLLVSRWGLRQALTQNLTIEWNKRFVRYEEFEDRVVAHFEDGTTAEADLLIGCDGARSLVRQQRCSELKISFIHIVSVGGSLPFSACNDSPTLQKHLDKKLARIFGLGGRTFLFFSYYNDVGEKRILWVLSWPYEDENSTPVWTNEECLRLAVKMSRDYFKHKDIPMLLEKTSLDDIFPPRLMYSLSVPRIANPLGKTTRVTLLGDAAHPMTTHAALGANCALQDALDLANAIKQEDAWPQKISEYEIKMLKRGFTAVQTSLRMTRMIHCRGYLATIRNWTCWIIGRVLKCSLKIIRFFRKSRH